ncbi:type VI secretion system membrane subunit TssM [Azotobacter chroococcum]|uniref:Type VI secretion system protein ImpL n=1 Tax=Azotobacter chroococcum TaxID=353 RepID=A0A4R1PKZ0_9GAMM|nr:type VI secretion system membrane subunit TssM [Azotobacter chroococcum]TBV98920.1 type VI secretion system membrane subunit TssM [Azotobacter chroococcum]TCL29344.1 type VI secretion system protein ImpL [Azotobacter chroococcum]
MRSLFVTLVACLRRTWVWSLCLLLLAALLLWYAGPLLAVAEHKVWASPASRLFSITLLCLAWGLSLVFAGWRARRRQLAEEADDEARERLRREGLIGEEQAVLQQNFHDALRTLKGDELPWYLLLGPQGSGKTSLLDFSGLDFPLNHGEAGRLTHEIAGTRHAEWYFGERAVLIDSPGRYLTQPEPAIDGAAWHALLDLLRRRRARPLDGVLVNVPLAWLGEAGETELESLARQIRQRLHELHRRLGVELPVYLVLGKADRLPGFDECFDQLSREESEQVFGASFRREQDGTAVAVVRGEFEALLRRLNDQLIARLHQERDSRRRGRILDFPRQLGLLGERLCLFVELAFAGNRYQRASRLRGFYLTSAPHLDLQLDPLTAGIGRRLGLSGNLPSLRQGRARFIRQLLERVIFPEAGLAGLDPQRRRRLDWGQRALYAGALAGLALFGAFWANGFSANHQRLEQLRASAERLERERQALGARDGARESLAALDASHAATRVFPPAGEIAWLQRGGLYQGGAVAPTLQRAYRRQLEELLLPRVARQLEAQIRASLGDRERLLGSLRAYLMLSLEERRDADYLKDWLAADWSQRHPGDAVAQHGLNEHFARLLAGPFAAYPLDQRLLAQAREALRRESLATVVYRMLGEQARRLPDYRLAAKLGPQGALIRGADQPIPGFYTQSGYRQFFVAQGAGLVRGLLRDNWVLGESEELSGKDFERLLTELEQLYFRDYANHWGEALARLSLEPLGGLAQGAQQLAGLGAANSPLLALLQEVRDNTRLDGPAPLAEASGEALAKTSAVPGKAAAELAPHPADGARQTLERRFAPLHRLLDDAGGAAPELAATLQALDALQLQLAGLAQAGAPEQVAFEQARARLGGRRDAIDQLQGSATRLPPPLGNALALLAGDAWRLILASAHQHLEQRYRSELYAVYRDSLRQRYPFDAASASEVALADFRAFFKVRGVADSFFERYLEPFLGGSPGQYRPRQVDGRGLPLSAEFLAQLGRLRGIQRSFFAENPEEPQVPFRLEPYALDAGLGRAEFRLGDRQLEYRHGPIVPEAFRWPVEAGDGRASLVVEELGGRRVGIERSGGPWALFRLLELLEIDHHRGRDVLLLKADLDGRQARYLLHSQRSPNPFDLALLRDFKLPAAL